ncbi:hypothetical protein [[Limnothrix rosea] IAM M-220]|uniref:hypothetical protein n=1 Tax=[Limnothrix rosea] IAM M-220 TaxID=454133 RepID=UPI0009687CF7|nr:hypothetical protein [[Limnothrix rosea] IAM M-220]OKH18651.1 hypothetical protein NIES208_04980 [[Limnothrix rosea] IAM M-220]
MVALTGKPSSLIHEITLEQNGAASLFRFSDSLQTKMEMLLEKKKADQLSTDEVLELEAIGELDRIFTHLNAMLLVQNAA